MRLFAQRALSRVRRAARPWHPILLLWLALCLATLNYNGPFYDEAIYVTAGLRVLEGYGLSDGYLDWFAGSLLWPTLAGVGYTLAGLIGTRIIAVLLTAIGFAAVVAAAENIYGSRAAVWTGVVLALSGPLYALARLGVYDVAAVAGLGLSLWAISQIARHDHRGWLVIAVAGLLLATVAKYPAGLMAVPLAGLLAALRRKRAGMDLLLFVFAFSAGMLALALPTRATLGTLMEWQIANKPTFGVTETMVAFRFIYLAGAPLLLACIGALAMSDRRRLAIAPLLAWFIWPAYHLLSGNPVSASKHLVFGLLFVAPLAGAAFDWLSKRRSGLPAVYFLVPLIAALGLVQGWQSTREWPDIRPAAAFLMTQVHPGQTLLISESWPFTMYLYGDGRVASPWDIFDPYRIAAGQSTRPLCRHDWFVETRGSYRWPEELLAEIDACSSFRTVFSVETQVVNLGQDLDFVAYPVGTVVWENVKGALAQWEAGKSD